MDAPAEMQTDASSRSHLGEVARYFLRLGFTAFGGPAAHVAMMEEHLVHRRKWLDRRHFLDLIAAINFIPGPNSTELAIHLGYVRAGWPGLFAAGACFITPAVLIILPIAWVYVRFGQLPQAQGLLHGVNAAVVAIVAAAVVRFSKTGIKDRFTFVIAIAAALAEFFVHRYRLALGDVATLATAAIAGALWYARPRLGKLPMLSLGPGVLAAAAVAAPAGIGLMTLLFLKIGATLFGSGYVLVTYLQTSFVDQRGWLTHGQLLDAVAVGQVTPGPLLTTATFIGFILGYQRFGGGFARAALSAVIATAAIFGPSFCFIALLGPVLPRLRNHPVARGALDGMNAAVVALIAVTTVILATQALRSPGAGAIAGLSLAALLVWNVNSTWLILASAIVGFAAHGRAWL